MFKHNPHIAESFWDAVLRKGGMPLAAAVNLAAAMPGLMLESTSVSMLEAELDARTDAGLDAGVDAKGVNKCLDRC